MNQIWKSLLNKNVKELRFILCQTNTKSIGLRNWINQNFVDIKIKNPDTLLLIRECKDADPMILARYDYGAEKKVICEFATQDEVESIVSQMVLEAEKINSNINNKF